MLILPHCPQEQKNSRKGRARGRYMVACSITSVMSDTATQWTLCDLMDFSLPDLSVHGILQARILEWVAISSSTVPRFMTSWTVAHQVPLSMVFPSKNTGVVISFSRGSSQPRGGTRISYIGGQVLCH